jgi:glycogen synthase
LNIVLVNPEYPSRTGSDHGGIATYVYSMANALAKAGNSVSVLAREGTHPDPLAAGVRFCTFGHVPARRPFPLMDRLLKNDCVWEQGVSRAIKELVIKLHAEKPVDCVEIPEYGGLAHEFGGALPFPVAVHFHTPTCLIDLYNGSRPDMRLRRRHAFEAKAISRASAYRSPSNAMKREACRRFGIREDRITVIPHPLDASAFNTTRRSSEAKGTIDILFSGRIERRKGAEILVRDAARILSLDPRIRITLAGELDMGDAGNYRNAIERSVSENDLSRLRFLGPVKREDLLRLYSASDMFLLPSLFENAPYVLLEAMAAKLPVVAARTGGIPEVITHGVTGLLFDIDNQESLLDAIKRFIVSPELAAACAEKAHTFVGLACMPEKIARRSEEFYAAIGGIG